jgi:hypothetical protein
VVRKQAIDNLYPLEVSIALALWIEVSTEEHDPIELTDEFKALSSPRQHPGKAFSGWQSA